MRICDRCKKGHAEYVTYAGNKELCRNCYKDYEDMYSIFDEMEKTFMKNYTLKHIDCDWR